MKSTFICESTESLANISGGKVARTSAGSFAKVLGGIEFNVSIGIILMSPAVNDDKTTSNALPDSAAAC